jgi:hypothetical protein
MAHYFSCINVLKVDTSAKSRPVRYERGQLARALATNQFASTLYVSDIVRPEGKMDMQHLVDALVGTSCTAKCIRPPVRPDETP